MIPRKCSTSLLLLASLLAAPCLAQEKPVPAAVPAHDLQDGVMLQFAQCWNPPAEAKNTSGMQVVLHVSYNKDGMLTQLAVGPESARGDAGDELYNAFSDSVVRAVHECSPLANLPAGQYEDWKEMVLTFDPHPLLP